MGRSQQGLDHASPPDSLNARHAPAFPWRTEPAIDAERRALLTRCKGRVPDVRQGLYPFKDVKLSRADIEWLLAVHEDQRGPVDWSDERQRARQGLDLRGADLRHLNLAGLPLARVIAGRNWTAQFPRTDEQRDMARVHLEGTDLEGAHLEGAHLGGAHLEGASLVGAHLQEGYLEGASLVGAHLEGAHLEGASLVGAHLEGASLVGAHLEGASLVGAHLEGKPAGMDLVKRVRQWDSDVLLPANLQRAFFDSGTTLEDVVLGEKKYGCVSLADVHWGGVDLSVVDWEAVTTLGDERKARQTTWLYSYRMAVRAYRQLAAALRKQGLNEEAARFAYRAEVLQRRVLWRQMLPLRKQGIKGLVRLVPKAARYLLSYVLDLFAGYGYKPLRSVIAYLLVIVGFMGVYAALDLALGPHLSWGELLTVSVAALHGGAFSSVQFKLGSPQAFCFVFEAAVGLIVEVGILLSFARRFFWK